MVEENQELLNKMFNAKKVIDVVKPGDSGPISTGKDEIVIIVDRSGSMANMRDDAQGGLNTFVTEQQQTGEAFLTIVEFDTELNTVHDRIDINEAEEYKLIPRGGTALLDAIGFVISNDLKYKAEGKTIVVVVTDGDERHSKEWTREGIVQLMEQRKADGWEFVFLAANQDAIATAQSYGFDANAAVSFAPTRKGFADVYDVTTQYTTNLRSVGKDQALKGRADYIQANLDTLSEDGAVGIEGKTE